MAIQHSILKRFLSGALLVLFALSITPKKVLHDWIVNHNDGIAASAKADTDQLHKAGFNCNVQNLVAESPFMAAQQSIAFMPLPVHSLQPAAALPEIFTTHCFFFEHRGPPTTC
jgi:hypothetical protein